MTSRRGGPILGRSGPHDREPGAIKVLVVLGTTVLYGMERAVIDIFDSVRPEVDPHFLICRTAIRNRLPLFREIETRGFEWSPFSDLWSWPMLGRPRSIKHALHMVVALILGNIDALRAARGRDVIYVPNLFFLLYAVAACFVFRITGRQVVYDFHNVPDNTSRLSLVVRVLHWLITDFVVGSEYALRCVREEQPYIDLQRLSIIRRSVARFDASGEAPLASFTDKINIVFIGQITPAKGVDLLVEAFNSLAADFPDSILHLVGGYDSPFEQRLRRLAAEAGTSERIILWGYRTDSARFLRNAYVLVQPSQPRIRESAGLSVLEAMAASVPAVVFSSGALQENVRHEETGLVCDTATRDSLCSALRQMLADPALRNQYADAALRRHHLLHTTDRSRCAWLSLLDKVDARGGAAG